MLEEVSREGLCLGTQRIRCGQSRVLGPHSGDGTLAVTCASGVSRVTGVAGSWGRDPCFERLAPDKGGTEGGGRAENQELGPSHETTPSPRSDHGLTTSVTLHRGRSVRSGRPPPGPSPGWTWVTSPYS